MHEIVQEFLVETNENLDQLDQDLVSLESDPCSKELLGSVFRTIHTVKGTTGFLGFGRLESLSHAAENLLSDLRDGKLELTSERTDALLEVVDALRGLLCAIEHSGEEDDRDLSTLIARIEHLRRADAGIAAARPGPAPLTAGTGEAARRSAGERSVRVDVDLLDSMMAQVGELVLARNQVSAHVELVDDRALRQSVQRLSTIVSELQGAVVKTRMQPVEQLWSKLPRVVRDLASQLSKRVSLETQGGETELDRSLLEAVKDPLTHLVRNAVDHAIELPAARAAAGKPEVGTVALRAYHEAGQVVLEVADDGAGIDRARIGAKALDRGLLSGSQLEAMSEREILDLVFRPGFSTAQTVTSVSGRGVGMDVVRTNVERIGGTVDLASVPGAGTTFRIRIPLTLAIVPALLVGCRRQRYAIPQANVLELVQLRSDRARSGIERVGDALVHRLRGMLLPLVRLDGTLGYAPLEPDQGPDAVSIVVLQAGALLLGVVADDILGTEEIVVKPLGRHLSQVPLFAGATILGDGSVVLVLDVIGLASAAGVEEATAGVGAETSEETTGAGEPSTYVLLRVGRARRVAVPLEAVARLEEAPAGAVEQAGAGQVMQYRGDLLPLVSLATVLRGTEQEEPAAGAVPGRVPVVVCSDGERHLGLVASEILDIVEGVFEIRAIGSSPGILGSTVVHGRATDVLDVHAAFEASLEEAGSVA